MSAPPYGSASDLPQMIEMRRGIASLKLLSMFMGREMRLQLAEVEHRAKQLCGLVDRFYSVLGPRNWIFTNQLPVDEVAHLLQAHSDVDVLEAGLIEVLAQRIHSSRWDLCLFGHEAMRVRHEQVVGAREHYLAERWDSCALALIPVMDGFVSEVEPARRRGLHARSPTEMVAWDSIVGHHKGLTSVMQTFLRPCKKRQEEPVVELYGHGIVHGTIINYNNVIVATKAWNMLSAVADWVSAKDAAAKPRKPAPTWRSTFLQLREYFVDAESRERFRPWSRCATEFGFYDIEIVKVATKFLEDWKAGRWGLLVPCLGSLSMVVHETSVRRRAVVAKEIYESSPLHAFEITSVSFPHASAARIHGSATIGDRTGRLELPWIRQRPDGRLARDEETQAAWVLAVYPPHAFIKDTISSTETT